MEKENKLVLIEDLYNGDLALISQKNQLNVLLNQPPKEIWLKEHPMVAGVKYLPVGKVEFLLTAIFQEWKVEVKNITTIANSVVVTVRVHYKNPVTQEWSWQDGVGAAVISTKKGAAAMDWNNVNTMSVMQAVPAAKSYAKKDAAEELGKIFGKDINRKEQNDYSVLQGKFVDKIEIENLKFKLSEAISESQDSELNQSVITETLEAEEAGVNTEDFYSRMIAKIQGI